jgi:hypothetical protein
MAKAVANAKPNTGVASIADPLGTRRTPSAPEAATRPAPEFDYQASAEFFPTRKRIPRRQPLAYKRFAQAAQAIRFAMEDLSPELLIGAFLEVDERRYGSDDIRRLYESSHYPLPRRRREP